MNEELLETDINNSDQVPIHDRLNRSLQLHHEGKLEEAKKGYEAILEKDPSQADVFCLLGVLAQQQGRYNDAIDLMKAAIVLNPLGPDYHQGLGDTYLQTNQFREAIECYQQVIRIKPDYYAAYKGMGDALAKLNLFEVAADSYQMAIKFQPTFGEAYFDLGRMLSKQGKLDAAIVVYRQAIQLTRSDAHSDPTQAQYLFETAKQFGQIGRSDEALELYRYAIQADPQHAKANWEIGNIYYKKSDLPKTLEYYRRAKQELPDNPFLRTNLGLALLSDGQYPEGWSEFEWRLKTPEYPNQYRNSGKPQWQGEDLHGKTILLHAEQGLGDTLQFVRYAPMVAQRGGRVILEVQPRLCKTLSQMPGVTQVIAAGESLPDFDCYCSLMSLPFVFRTTVDTIPGKSPYIRINPEAVEAARKQWPDRGLRVGIAWSGSPTNPVHNCRSMLLRQLSPLGKVEGVSLYSLQVGEASKQIATAAADFQVVDVCSGYTDFFDTAAFVSGLDLVITIDTSVAHLAGALGIPVWILLTKEWTDWRWLHNRTTSPWYPSARLFRQSKTADWSGLMDLVKSELEQFASFNMPATSKSNSSSN